jgi:carbamoyltransferase
MNYVGISCGFHDAALSVIDDRGNILFAGHSERYSMKKHDSKLCSGIVADAKNYINNDFEVHYYERPYVKAVRQFIAKQKLGPFNVNEIIGKHNLYQLESFKHIRQGKVKTHNHHLCHAAAGFQTSPYQDATVVVIDAIGELDTISIWDAKYDKQGKATYKKIWGRRYPDSIGLFYSAMTARVGLRPLDEEYILMGMAAYGKPVYAPAMQRLFTNIDEIGLEDNLHIGVDDDFLREADEMDIAASAQAVVEQLIETVIKKAKKLGKSDNLVYGGGVALNCLANRLIGKHYQNIWIMPNPGDAGNSLGAAALGYGKKINWTDAFLGFDINGEYPVDNILKELYTNKMVGVASGRAEFGPRALGNRSLLADPRGPDIKDKVNDIKRRQQFRPFAPVILEELVTDYFDMPFGWSDSRYMQVIATCRHPDLFPAIVHADGTARVQTVPKDGSGIRKLLEAWYKETGCPILLNTSLNIRGEPMVNNRSDADRFEKLYNLKVCS